MRKVKLYSTLNGIKVIESEATDYGSLKPEINTAGFDTNNFEVIIKESNLSVNHDDAELPEGDFTLVFTPKNIKAGMAVEIPDSYVELRYMINLQDYKINSYINEELSNKGVNHISKLQSASLKSILTKFFQDHTNASDLDELRVVETKLRKILHSNNLEESFVNRIDFILVEVTSLISDIEEEDQDEELESYIEDRS